MTNKKESTVKVVLDRDGARAVGPYAPGVVYEVEKDEAARLIKVKGFKRATAAMIKKLTNQDGDQ